MPDSVKTAAMRAMLPRDVLERFFDGPFNYEGLRMRVSAGVGEKLAGEEASDGAQPVDIGKLDNPNEGDKDVNAVQRHQRQRPNQKSRSDSDNERKHPNCQTAVPTPPTPRQRNPRGHKIDCAQDDTARVLQVWRQSPSCHVVSTH